MSHQELLQTILSDDRISEIFSEAQDKLNDSSDFDDRVLGGSANFEKAIWIDSFGNSEDEPDIRLRVRLDISPKDDEEDVDFTIDDEAEEEAEEIGLDCLREAASSLGHDWHDLLIELGVGDGEDGAFIAVSLNGDFCETGPGEYHRAFIFAE